MPSGQLIAIVLMGFLEQKLLDRFPELRGAFNKFKIVVDSWKFSILLLYILWDDWPIL